jgi:2-oxoglutarate ferredoxin oxidoreductase subunit alpha
MDLDLGMNFWSSDPLSLEKEPYDYGKRLSAEQLEEWTKAGKKFRRYFDQDGDGIPYRTVPGNPHRMASYFTRGSGHDADARYSEDENDYKYILDRLKKKFETARKFVPKPIVEKERGVKTGIICYGSSYEAVREPAQVKSPGIENQPHVNPGLPLTKEVRISWWSTTPFTSWSRTATVKWPPSSKTKIPSWERRLLAYSYTTAYL